MNKQIEQIMRLGYKKLRKQQKIKRDKNNTLIQQRKLQTPWNAWDPSQIPDQQNITTIDLNVHVQRSQKTPNECVKWENVHVHIIKVLFQLVCALSDQKRLNNLILTAYYKKYMKRLDRRMTKSYRFDVVFLKYITMLV